MSDEKAKFFHNLNPQQVEAVKHFEGPALVVAGPGSGKTRVLTHRVSYLLEEKGVSESNILCVTFTNKAANEIKSRVGALLSGGFSKLPWSGTFHSICSKILRKDGYLLGLAPSFVIYDTDDQLSLIKQIVKDFGYDPKKVNAHAVLSTISGAKNELITSESYASYSHGFFQKIVARIYPEYQKRLRDNGALDFDDILVECVNLFTRNPETLRKYQELFKFIMVDEYQDTNKAQYVLCKLLASLYRNIFVVGDMSQAIYSFRGADYRNILNFQTDYPEAKIYNLEQNYRSTQTILDAAKSIIKNNTNHISLELWTENDKGEKVIYYTGSDDKDEGHFVVNNIKNLLDEYAYKDIAVLYRTNAQSRGLEEHLLKSSIPYRIFGGLRFYSRKEIKDIIAFLRVIHNPKDSVAWERIINVPPRGVGGKTEAKIKEAGWDLDMIESAARLPIKTWVGLKETSSTLELLERILTDTKYIEWLSDGSEESIYRVENINELKTVALEFPVLGDFLENVSLVESSDKTNQADANAVTLTTIHASKGLEFPVVFMIGVEEGLFPHTNAMMEQDGLEEERRLCYVAVTRTMKKLFITNARSRVYFGSVQANMPSRFVSEIPENLIDYQGLLRGRGRFGSGSFGKNVDDYLDDLEGDRRNFSW